MDAKRKREIINAFRHYNDNKIKSGNLTESLIASMVGSTRYDRIAVSSSPCNTFENKMVKYLDEKERIIRWINAIEYTIIRYRLDYKSKVLNALFFDNWTIHKTARKLHVGVNTVARWKEEILITADAYARDFKV